jgi:hypothetical protein
MQFAGSHLATSLVSFNVGVELGQLAFVASILATGAVLVRLELRWPRWAPYLPAYAIGSVAMLWVLERVAAFAG